MVKIKKILTLFSDFLFTTGVGASVSSLDGPISTTSTNYENVQIFTYSIF